MITVINRTDIISSKYGDWFIVVLFIKRQEKYTGMDNTEAIFSHKP